MNYRTILVSLPPGRANGRLMAASVDLAKRFDAVLLGRAACRPIHCLCHDYPVPAGLFEEDRRQRERHLLEAEADFRTATASLRQPADWSGRSCLEPLADHLAGESAAADLIIAGTAKKGDPFDATRQPDLCDLVMKAGRPVLLLPQSRDPASFDRILVAWKDSREARRAIADALPLLKAATRVTVVTMDAAEDQALARTSVARVANWLARHDIKAETLVVPTMKANASQLLEIARGGDANLIVAGAYGYSREGKWTLGGVTAELLTGERCAFLSH
ncbi:universal stress protein [Reyranella sp. MMS21-HV4-11]|uniref:Universal stress protein n=1 Tax=Reyranella humidisoli TaxID=2849149 RepID=A0ABS6IE65_9HYPH|nr:universal stress protein [Reyranella sp. MMS21-HV4-11]MBU8872896.1 universal stress protein [Reyranella sp. MMS21-HV4-11]